MSLAIIAALVQARAPRKSHACCLWLFAYLAMAADTGASLIRAHMQRLQRSDMAGVVNEWTWALNWAELDAVLATWRRTMTRLQMM